MRLGASADTHGRGIGGRRVSRRWSAVLGRQQKPPPAAIAPGGPAALAAFVIAMAAAIEPASAQQRPPALPPSVPPEIRLPQLAPETAPALPAPEIPVPETAPSRAPAGAEAVKLTFAGFELEGVEAYPPGELEKIWRADVGREISLARVYALARDIQQRYRKDGYFLSRVLIPEQTVHDGRFRLRVLEGWIAQVTFEGEIGPAAGLVASYFQPVTRQRPIRLATLDRALLLANDVPGIGATALLRSSTREVGAADLVVTLRRQKVSGFLSVDNYGDQFTGEWEFGAGLSANSFTSVGEQTTIIGFSSEPWTEHYEAVGQFNGSWRLGASGAYAEALASYGDSNPGSDLDTLDFDSKTLLLSGTGGYPIIRSRDLNLSLRLGFDYINEDTDIFGGQTFSRDRLRVLHTTVRADARDALAGSTAGEISYRQGLPILDATKRGDDDKSRENATGSAGLVRGSLARLQPLIASFALYGDVAAQYAFDHLLSEEQFDVGGTSFGRGYDFSEISGDHGVGTTVELRYTWRPLEDVPISLQPFSFYDYGRVWDRGASEPQTLSSAGFGVRLAAYDALTMEATMAKPLAADSQRANGTRDPQFLFRTIGRF